MVGRLAPGPKKPKHSNSKLPSRVIIEFCCGPNSKLGRVAEIPEARNCTVHRVTEQNDVTTVSGRQFVIDKINAANKNHQQIMLFASMPCTGGSLWGNINRHKQGGEAKLRKHWTLFRKIWKCFEECAILVLNLGGCVALEWPKGCRYWKWDFVRAFLEC